jgi:hypothetical protein
MIVWGQQKYRKIIPFDKSNVATFSTMPGCKAFRIFCACFEAGQDNEGLEEGLQDTIAFDATLIVDDEADNDEVARNDEHEPDDDKSNTPITIQGGCQRDAIISDEQSKGDNTGYIVKSMGHHDIFYEKDKNVAVVEDGEDDAFEGRLKPTAKVLLWHFQLGHIPFSRIQTMAKEGLLPRSLSNCRLPKCSSRMYGKMTRRAKRTKNKKSKTKDRTITDPGSCVSARVKNDGSDRSHERNTNSATLPVCNNLC